MDLILNPLQLCVRRVVISNFPPKKVHCFSGTNNSKSTATTMYLKSIPAWSPCTMLNGQKLKHLKSHSNPTPSALVTGMTTALWVWPRFHSMDLGRSTVPFRYGHNHCAIGMTPGIWNIRRRTTRWIRNRRQVQVRWLFRRVGAKFRQCWPRWDLRRARQFSLCGRIRSRWRTTSDARTERKPSTRDSMES